MNHQLSQLVVFQTLSNPAVETTAKPTGTVKWLLPCVTSVPPSWMWPREPRREKCFEKMLFPQLFFFSGGKWIQKHALPKKNSYDWLGKQMRFHIGGICLIHGGCSIVMLVFGGVDLMLRYIHNCICRHMSCNSH